MQSPPTRAGSALIGFLVGIFLVLSGFALGMVAERELFGTSPTATTTGQAVAIPTISAPPTDTAAPGRPTSTPRPVPTPVPSVTPRPSDPPISIAGAKNTTPKELQDQFKEFWQAFQLLENSFYYRPLDEQKLIYGALKGMYGASGDDYTVFLEPQANQDRKDSDNGRFVGIGIYVDAQATTELKVASVIRKGPAEAAGVKGGDVITAVDGKSLAGLSLDDQRAPLRGPEGSMVMLTIRRDGEPGPLDLTVTRRKIIIPPVTLDVLPGDIGHLTITGFNDYEQDDLDAALQQVQDKHLKGLVLDLRDNGGGYVQGAQRLLGRFLPKDSVAMLEDRRPTGGQLTPLKVEVKGDQLLDIPLVLLVNGGTASASEITAGALQDYGRATMIGTKTYGKGSEQSVTQFDDGASARVTIANWYTPKQRVIQKQGLTPEIIVEQPKDTPRTMSDPQLDKAVEIIRGKIAP